ncbi:MAG: response regulator [Bacteroidales bacterium]
MLTKFSSKRFQFVLKMLFVFVSSCLVPHLYAGNDYYYRKFNVEKQLSHTTVTSTLLTENGELWIGTGFGLNRYDGYEMKNYFHKANDPFSLSGNYILFLTQDAQNTIWVSTMGGLVKYDQATDRFTSPVSGNNIKVYATSLIPDGVLFGGTNALYRYNYNDSSFQHLPIDDSELASSKVVHISKWDSDSYILVYANAQIRLYHATTGAISKLPFSLPLRNILAFYLDEAKNMYVSVFNDGLYIFDKNGDQKHHLTSENSDLAYNIILDMVEKDGNIWLATDGGGVSILNLENPRSITNIQHVSGDENSIPTNSIGSLYKDVEGNIWAGSIKVGLFEIKEVSIQTYKNVPFGSNYGVSNKTISSLYLGSEGNIWIGTEGGGLNCFNPRTKKFKHFASTDNEKVISIAEYSPRELLVLFYGKGLFKFNKTNGSVSPFDISETPNRLYQLGSNRLLAITNTPFIYDIQTKARLYLKIEGVTDPLLSLKVIHVDREGCFLWGEKQIMRLNFATNTISSFYKIEDGEIIQTVNKDNDGLFWVGTDQGLRFFDPSRKRYAKLTTNLFDRVTAIVPVADSILWIGARNMLFSYNKHNERFQIWEEADGFSHNEVTDAYIWSKDLPALYLAGVEGLIQIDKSIQTMHEKETELRLNDIEVDGITVLNSKEYKENGFASISLPWDYNVLKIKVSAIDKDVFRKKLYRYTVVKEMLPGENNRDIESYNSTLTLNMLSPGNYTIYLSCFTVNGDWSSPEKIVEMHILPPWYLRTHTKITLFVLIATLVIAIVLFILRRKEQLQKREMNEVLQMANQEKINFLINVSHELRTPLTLIYTPLKRMIEKFDGDSPLNEDMEYLKKHLVGIHKSANRMKAIINMTLDVNAINVPKDERISEEYALFTSDNLFSEGYKEESMVSTNDRTVLIAEDNEDLRLFLFEVLSKNYKEVSIASNGAEALELIRKKMPDIVISDIMMPAMDGYELCHRLKTDPVTSHIPVLLLTARGDVQSNINGFRLGADAFIPKPFDLDFLEVTMHTLLSNRELLKQKYRDAFVRLTDRTSVSVTNKDEEFLSKLNQLIFDNMSTNTLDIKFLTEQMHISRTPLYAKLKALTNLGVNDYINRLRIEKGAEMLVTSDLTITEISTTVGFEYPKYFSTLFKQVKGVTPTQYRKQNSVNS